jgi:glycosyltransferase involved in cell wall biosynthesis
VKPVRILHCHSTFSLGGKEARAVRLMNVFGDRAEHTILSAMPDALGARDAIDPSVKVSFPGENAPSLHGKPSPARYDLISRYMQQFDLVLTYNWGSMDAVGARRMFEPFRKLPPLIHHEDGFNTDESERLNTKRNLFRRLMLPTAHAVVVPSQRLEHIATNIWKQPASRILRIPNGIDVAAYQNAPQSDVIPGFVRLPGDVIVGTLAGLRAVKNLPKLVRAVTVQPEHVKLVIVGEGPERERILAEADRLGIADRVLLAGFLAEPHRYVGHFDVFALSSQSEQFPISLVEAMAAGKPAVSTDVGDVMSIVSEQNQQFIVPETDEGAFARALGGLVEDCDLRLEIGSANRALAIADYGEAAMIARYGLLYGAAMGRADAFKSS